MQGELFKMSGPVTEASQLSAGQANWLERFRVTLRFDHLSIFGVSALVFYVLVFSFGVENGKRIALRELQAEQEKKESLLRELRSAETPAPKETLPPEVVPPPEAAEDSPLPAVGKYTIQVITFLSQRRADEEVKKLKEKGYSSFIIPGGRFFQVCVDRFENMSEAREKLIQLRAGRLAPSDAFIRPLKGQISL